jgi:hypothetical protein
MTPPNLQREAQALILYDPVFPADPFAPAKQAGEP